MPPAARKPHSRQAERRIVLVPTLMAGLDRLMDAGASYTELSVERLLREVDVSRTTFYAHFRDKGDLLAAGAGQMIDDVVAGSAHWWRLGPDDTRADVLAAITAIDDAFTPHRTTMAAVLEAAPYDAAVRDRFRTLTEDAVGEVARHIADGQRAGFVRPELEPGRTAEWLAWMIERGMGTFARHPDPAARDRHLDALAGILWNTLYAGGR